MRIGRFDAGFGRGAESGRISWHPSTYHAAVRLWGNLWFGIVWRALAAGEGTDEV